MKSNLRRLNGTVSNARTALVLTVIIIIIIIVIMRPPGNDPLAMSLYALSLQPLITGLQLTSSAKQCWFADDATGAGSLVELKKWWDELNNLGPDLGYYPNASKCWLVIKPDKESDAKELFADSSINIYTQGQKHLGAALGSRSFLEEYVNGKVED